MTQILSIQSHVAYGYVGNRAAVFPLQRLGIDVTALNTVQFSNHTGYGEFSGEIFSPSQLQKVMDGIEARGVLPAMQAVLSGYMGDERVGRVVLDAVARIKQSNPQAVYCCDPVMGDVGRGFFVHAGIPEWMRDHALPAADIATPNQFELSYLTGRDIHSLADAIDAAAALRAMGPGTVLVTSLTRDDAPEHTIEMLLDTAAGSWLVTTPRFDFATPPNGAGDFTAAVFLAHYLQGLAPQQQLEATAGAVHALFTHTFTAGTRELALIAAQDDFVMPDVIFPAERVR
ncbi:pyridoxal kinase PdxY [Phytohalomonas tamaricis]|uniref:pyridoxal kinase PdxY n=1 Tax=Phytohalomonas tamaricis TaxID=2081032 RepID=UPI000D0B7E6B|nr:pyridoxal kinase PdxY [Phytohalomonas tamaricis]